MIRVSYGLDQDQHQHYVDTDLGPNYLQRLSMDDKSRASNLILHQAFS